MFSLIWQVGAQPVGQIVYPISFPGQATEARPVTLNSNAVEEGTMESLRAVRFYLSGDPADLSLVQTVWPYLGGLSDESARGAHDAVHLRPEMDGGVELSFDRGQSWTRMQYQPLNLDGGNAGYQADPLTWINLPAFAVGLQGVNNTLAPFDQAHLMLRVIVPPQADSYRLLDVRLSADSDIV